MISNGPQYSPLYQQYGQQNNFLNFVSQFRQNPRAMIAQRYNIPQEMNDPNQILQYLLNTNQVSQDQVNKAMRMKNDPQMQQYFR